MQILEGGKVRKMKNVEDNCRKYATEMQKC